MATRDTYTKQEWENLPSEETPITAERLTHIEDGIKNAMDNRALKEIYGDYDISLGRKNGTTVGSFSTAEGNSNVASEYCSHAEGYSNIASAIKSHAEGESTHAAGDSAHSEGYSTKALSRYSHSEGYITKASEMASHAEGGYTTASGQYAHAEGYNTTASNYYSHAEGAYTTASGDRSHAEGDSTQGKGASSHAEGYNTKAYNSYCHAEGYCTIAGSESNMYVNSCHAEGIDTQATGKASHAEGIKTQATGEGSHAEGMDTEQLNPMARAVHMEGIGTQAVEDAQHVSGKYNIPSSGLAFIVGGGTSGNDRKNIYMLDWNGNAIFAGNVQGSYNGRTISLYGLQMELEGRYNSLLNGIMPAKVFDAKADLDEWLAVEGNPETLKTGQNIYIVEAGTPDYWWDGTGLQVLETDKVVVESLTYDETMAILNDSREVA